MSATKRANILLWTVQGLLAALFLLAGGMKLVLPLTALRGPVELPGSFLRFVGVAEVAGALGLVLPGVVGVWRSLTPVAAVGLVTIMSGAVTVTVEGHLYGAAVVPLVVGALAATIAVRRREWRVEPARARTAPRLHVTHAA